MLEIQDRHIDEVPRLGRYCPKRAIVYINFSFLVAFFASCPAAFRAFQYERVVFCRPVLAFSCSRAVMTAGAELQGDGHRQFFRSSALNSCSLNAARSSSASALVTIWSIFSASNGMGFPVSGSMILPQFTSPAASMRFV